MVHHIDESDGRFVQHSLAQLTGQGRTYYKGVDQLMNDLFGRWLRYPLKFD
jgi:hypothetical protein